MHIITFCISGSAGLLGYKAKYGCKYHIPLDFSILKEEQGISTFKIGS